MDREKARVTVFDFEAEFGDYRLVESLYSRTGPFNWSVPCGDTDRLQAARGQ